MSGKSKRRQRIKANHLRLWNEYVKWVFAEGDDYPALTYRQWLHPHMRERYAQRT
jgi:predicted alpha/beta hydrolase